MRYQNRPITHNKKPLPAVAVMAKVKDRPTRKVMLDNAAIHVDGKTRQSRLGPVSRDGMGHLY